MLMFGISSSYATDPPPTLCTNGPTDYLAYYPLDGDFLDHSINGFHATLVGSLSFVAGKYSNGATGFSSGNYFRLPNFGQTVGSLTAWVYLNSHKTQKIFRGSAYPKGPPCIGEFNNNWEVCGTSFTAVQTGQWYHIALIEGTGVYINGVLLPGSNIPNMDPTNNDIINVGGPPYNEWFSGIVDDIKFYGRALTQDEVRHMAGILYVSDSDGDYFNSTNWVYDCAPPNPIPAGVTVILKNDMSIGTGNTVTINGTLNIDSGKTLTNNGSLIFSGSSFTNTGIYIGTGTFTGTFINQGTVKPGGGS